MKNIQIVSWLVVIALAYLAVFYGDDYLNLAYHLTLFVAIGAIIHMSVLYLVNNDMRPTRRRIFVFIVSATWLLFWHQHFIKINPWSLGFAFDIATVFLWYLIINGLRYVTRKLL